MQYLAKLIRHAHGKMVVESHGRMVVVVASGKMEAEKIGRTVVDGEMVDGGMEAVASGNMVVKVS